MLPNLASHAFYSVLLLVFNLLPGIFAARCLNCYDDPSNGAAHDAQSTALGLLLLLPMWVPWQLPLL